MLTSDLLWLMASMGQGDDLALVDAIHTGARISRASVTCLLIRLTGLHLPEVIGAITSQILAPETMGKTLSETSHAMH